MGRPATLQIRVTSDSQQAQQDVGQLPGRFDSAFSKMSAAGPAIGGAIGGLVAGALIDAFGKAMQQTKLTAKLGAQLGSTPQEAKRLGKIAGDLYAKGIADSFETGIAAVKATMQSGLLPAGATTKQIKEVSTKLTDLATVFEQDSTQLARAVSQMIKTGLADSSEEAFDVLTKGFQAGNDQAGDLLDTFSEYSTQFRKLGLDGATAMGIISQGLKGGARDADVAADAIKEFSLRSIDGSKLTAEGFRAIGLDAEKMAAQIAAGGPPAAAALDLTLDRIRAMKDPVEQAAAATALFGTQSEDLGAALNAMDPSTAVAALGQVEGATKRMGDQMRETSEHDITTLWTTMQQKLVNLLNEEAVPAVGNASNVLRELSPVLKDGAALIAGPVYFGWKLLVGILGTVTSTVRRVGEEFGLTGKSGGSMGVTIRDDLLPGLNRLASLVSGTVSPAISILGSVFIKIGGAIAFVSGQVSSLINWLSSLKGWFASISPPSWLSSVGSFISGAGSFSASSFSAGPSAFAADTMAAAGPTTFVSADRAAQFSLSTVTPTPVGIQVFIDGQQIDARTRRIVSSAMQADGARWQARGWL